MQDLNERMYRTISHIIDNGIYPNLKIEDNIAYTIDPVYKITRNRVNAECVKTLLRINGMGDKDHSEVIKKLLNQLVNKQGSDGCWNEIHAKYDEPSALITSIVGEALLDGYLGLGMGDLEDHIHLARDFVLANYTSPGYFKKSSVYVADHLNVDATCGAFIAKYGKVFCDDKCLEIAKKTADHICKYQFSDGAYPYTNDNHGNYQYGLEIPCIHYQGVTIYYLLKILDAFGDSWLNEEINKGIDWLVSVQYDDGRFDWSKSGLMFAYYLSGAYAFAIPCFLYGNNSYVSNSSAAMDVLESNIKDIANRWESAPMRGLPASLFTSVKTANLGEYPLKHRLFRFGYGMYRQYARRRFSEGVNPKLFNFLSSIMGINTSTIEPDNNFPDLFMTSEILDCLSYSLTKYYNNTEINT